MQRKKYDGPFKAKVALEVVKGLKTINEIAADFGVHPNMLTKWKKQLLEGLPGLFASFEQPRQSGEGNRAARSLSLSENRPVGDRARPA